MGILGKVFGWLVGGSPAVDKVASVVDKAIYTKQEQAEASAVAVDVDQRDLADARGMQFPSHQSGIDIIIDAWNRAIRPGVTTWLIGGWVGWWDFPESNAVDPFWQNITLLVLTFWFGGRALLKDLPAAVRAMRGR